MIFVVEVHTFNLCFTDFSASQKTQSGKVKMIATADSFNTETWNTCKKIPHHTYPHRRSTDVKVYFQWGKGCKKKDTILTRQGAKVVVNPQSLKQTLSIDIINGQTKGSHSQATTNIWGEGTNCRKFMPAPPPPPPLIIVFPYALQVSSYTSTPPGKVLYLTYQFIIHQM